MKILVTPTSLQPGKNDVLLKPLLEFADEVVFNPSGRPLTEDELRAQLSDCDGYLAGLDFVSAKALENCQRLKAISRYGVGVDRVDLAAAKAKGIVVTNTPGANSEAVGELTFGLILCLARKIAHLDNQTKSGGWPRANGIELAGKTLGILGLGAIGKIVARCASGFQMNVMAYDPFLNEAYCREHRITPASLTDVVRQSDVLSLHLPLTEETYHLIHAETFAIMKKGAILINASRGGLVDEDAAYEALKNKTLGGLGMDAFESEPPGCPKLFALENVVATPHTGAHTQEAAQNMARMSIQNLIDVLSGRECPYIV